MVTKAGKTTVKNAAPKIDPEVEFGITPDGGHTPDMVQRMSMVLTDLRSQLDGVSASLVENPNDLSAALAWKKLSSLSNVMSSSLANGRASDAAMESLQSLNLYAKSDSELLTKTMDAINTAMPLGVDGMPSTKMISMQAEMLLDIPQGDRKIGLLRRFEELGGEELGFLYKEQRRVTALLTEACD